MEGKADQLMAEGEAALKKFSLTGMLFGGGTEKFEEASDKFKRAANSYKATKKWAEAAKAYRRAAECFQKTKDELETTQCFTDAARMLIKAGNPDEATQLLESEALPRMVDAGRLAQAAKLHDEVAKIFEDEHAFPQAIEHYGKACDLFSAENSASTAAKSKQNVARLCAMLDPPDYARSSETYAECGMDAMASQLLKFGAKDLFARAVFCTLARNDLVTAQQQFDKFKEQDFTLEGSREGKLLTDLIKAFENQNGDAFADALFQYNSISALDSWKVSVLRAAKDHLAEPEAAGSAAAGADDESSLM